MTRMELTGDVELRRLFQQLPGRMLTKYVRRGVSETLTPASRIAKSHAPKRSRSRDGSPHPRGVLRKSIGKVVRTNRHTKVVFGAVGPRSGFAAVPPGKRRAEDPRRYAHLVENGVTALGIPPSPFIRPAHLHVRSTAINTIGNKVREGIAIEAAKAVRA